MNINHKIILLIIFCISISVTGCDNNPKEGQSRNVVTLRWISDSNPARQEQIAMFEKANPGIKVNLDWGSLGLEKTLVQIAGGTPPDLVDCHMPFILRTFAQKGVLFDITPYCKKYDLNLKDFWPQCSPYMYYQDKVYAIPTNASTVVLFYNKKIFDENHITYPDENWTWDTFISNAQKLTKIEPDKKIYEYFGAGLGRADIFLPWQFGADFYSDDGKRCIIDSEGGKKAARLLYELAFKYHVTPTRSEMQNLSAIPGWGQGELNIFGSGKLAMSFNGRHAVINFRKVKNMNWGIAPVPYHKDGKRATWFASRSTAICKGTKHPEEAFKFLMFLASKDYNELIVRSGDGFPAVISIANSNMFLSDLEHPNETQNNIYIESVEYSKPIPISPYVYEIEVERIVNYETDLMWLNKQSPEETMENIAKKVNILIVEILNKQ